MREVRSVREIVQDAGGAAVVAPRVGLGRGSVSKWYRNGIPDRYWPAIMDMVPRLSPSELLCANEAARISKRSTAA